MYDDRKDGGGETPGRNEESRDGAGFIENIASPLRKRERVDATFEVRVMSAVHARSNEWRDGAGEFDSMAILARGADSRVHHTAAPFLRRFVTLAAAAALLLTAGYGARSGWLGDGPRSLLGGLRDSSDADRGSAANDNERAGLRLVSFTLRAPNASGVLLVGAFNSWVKGATPLTMANEPGVWTVSLSLPPGRHEYAFIVSDSQGEQWVPDPSALTLRDEFGTVSSIVMVDDTRAQRALGSES
jgi:hypothetical protein